MSRCPHAVREPSQCVDPREFGRERGVELRRNNNNITIVDNNIVIYLYRRIGRVHGVRKRLRPALIAFKTLFCRTGGRRIQHVLNGVLIVCAKRAAARETKTHCGRRATGRHCDFCNRVSTIKFGGALARVRHRVPEKKIIRRKIRFFFEFVIGRTNHSISPPLHRFLSTTDQ